MPCPFSDFKALYPTATFPIPAATAVPASSPNKTLKSPVDIELPAFTPATKLDVPAVGVIIPPALAMPERNKSLKR